MPAFWTIRRKPDTLTGNKHHGSLEGHKRRLAIGGDLSDRGSCLPHNATSLRLEKPGTAGACSASNLLRDMLTIISENILQESLAYSSTSGLHCGPCHTRDRIRRLSAHLDIDRRIRLLLACAISYTYLAHHD